MLIVVQNFLKHLSRAYTYFKLEKKILSDSKVIEYLE